MAYVSHIQLNERPGARELAQVASDIQSPVVPDELMELTLKAGDRTAWTPEQIEQADQAMLRIDDAIADADGLIDGYLRQRGYPLPLTPVHRVVTVWSRAITRYYLHMRRKSMESDDPIVRDYRDALKLLQQVANGKLSLGVDDELAESGVGDVMVKKGCTPVRDALRDY